MLSIKNKVILIYCIAFITCTRTIYCLVIENAVQKQNLISNYNSRTCVPMEIVTRNQKTDKECYYGVWKGNDSTQSPVYTNALIMKWPESSLICYDPHQCYSIELWSYFYECEYKVMVGEKVAKRGFINSTKTGSDTWTLPTLVQVGNCERTCGDNAKMFFSMMYRPDLTLNYTLSSSDKTQVSSDYIYGRALTKVCLDLSKCNLMTSKMRDDKGVHMFLLASNDTVVHTKWIDPYETFGDCPTCPLAILISKVPASNGGDGLECHGYELYEDDRLFKEECIKEGVSRSICLDSRKCYTMKHNGAAHLFILKDQKYFSDGLSSQYSNFGTCTCSDKHLMSSTRGENILVRLSTLSGTEKLTNTESVQNKAVCWLIHYDVHQLNATSLNLLQRYIVSLIYFATNGDGWKYGYGFLSGKHECGWYNIGCTNQIVTSIDLSHNNLTGNIVSEIYFLSSLEELKLDGNFLTGPIPRGLGLLNTRIINLADNKLSGKIPKDIFDMKELEEIRLNNNLFTGRLPISTKTFDNLHIFSAYGNAISGTIPDWIGKINKLQILDLHSNHIHGFIPKNIEQLSQLNTFDLSFNRLNGTLPTNIFMIPSLSSFRIESNEVSGIIPQDFAQNSQITVLSLKENRFIGTVPSQLSSLLQLEKLYISNNTLSGDFPSYINTLKKLHILEAHYNNITGAIPQEHCNQFLILTTDCDIPELVSCACCTQCYGIFSVSDNEHCVDTKFSIDFRSSTDAENINFTLKDENNNIILQDFQTETKEKDYPYEACISNTGCFYLESFSSTDRIEFDVIANDQKLFKSVPAFAHLAFGYSINGSLLPNTCDEYEVCNMSLVPSTDHRRILNMVDEENLEDELSPQYQALCWLLSGFKESKITMPDGVIIQRYALAVLYFSTEGDDWHRKKNWLSDESACDWYGISCDNFYGAITKIDLSSNNLFGYIPSTLVRLNALEYLALQSNKLHGDIVEELTKLKNLKALKLSENLLDNTIPTKIGLLNDLEVLDVSYNMITGTLPPSMGDLKHITYVDLSNNHITGEAAILFNLTTLKMLNVSRNFLQGKIEMQKNNSLEILDLSENYFSGPLSSFGKSSKNLKYMHLQSNHLTSTIPAGIGEIENLEELYLFNNRLEGPLPSEVGNLRNLTKLSFAYNKFRGTLASNFENLLKLETFHLHQNQLIKNLDLFNYSIKSFISDCGNTQSTQSLTTCATCTECCNQDGDCVNEARTWPKNRTLKGSEGSASRTLCVIIAVPCLLLLAISYPLMLVRRKLPHSKLRYNVREHFQKESVYRFLLSPNKLPWVIGVVTIIFQIWISTTFLRSGDKTRKFNEWYFEMSCPSHSTECVNNLRTTPIGWLTAGLIVAVFLLPQLIDGVMVFYRGLLMRSFHQVIAGLMLFYISVVVIMASIVFLLAISPTDGLLLKDVICVLYLNDIDEQIFASVNKLFPSYVASVEEDIKFELTIEEENFHLDVEEKKKQDGEHSETCDGVIRTSVNGTEGTPIPNREVLEKETKASDDLNDLREEVRKDMHLFTAEIRKENEGIKKENEVIKKENAVLSKEVKSLQDQVNSLKQFLPQS